MDHQGHAPNSQMHFEAAPSVKYLESTGAEGSPRRELLNKGISSLTHYEKDVWVQAKNSVHEDR
jgi:hypothetical protein